ncbi:P-selectin-like [Halichondria panicea]|uniref:P-selectin-like n=1 Tax=Halichondria panicea TaxID=6063 RepID=UPI00312B4AA6
MTQAGTPTRTCEDPDTDLVGTWTGTMSDCEVIFCLEVTAPVNATFIIFNHLPTQLLGVGSVATYSCDPGYTLLGSPTRTCENPDTDSMGTWTGAMPDCEVIFCPEITAPVNGTLIISTLSQPNSLVWAPLSSTRVTLAMFWLVISL